MGSGSQTRMKMQLYIRKDARNIGVVAKGTVLERGGFKKIVENAKFLEDQTKSRPKTVWTENQRSRRCSRKKERNKVY